jgi:hypothetical protein
MEWAACTVKKHDPRPGLNKQELTLAGYEDLVRSGAARARHHQEVASRACALDNHIFSQVRPLLDESDAITGLRERPVGRRCPIDRQRQQNRDGEKRLIALA